jgi:hypothetical protein
MLRLGAMLLSITFIYFFFVNFTVILVISDIFPEISNMNNRFTNESVFRNLNLSKKRGKKSMIEDEKKARIAELKLDYIRIQEDMEKMESTGRNIDHAERQLQAIEDELKQLRL